MYMNPPEVKLQSTKVPTHLHQAVCVIPISPDGSESDCLVFSQKLLPLPLLPLLLLLVSHCQRFIPLPLLLNYNNKTTTTTTNSCSHQEFNLVKDRDTADMEDDRLAIICSMS